MSFADARSGSSRLLLIPLALLALAASAGARRYAVRFPAVPALEIAAAGARRAWRRQLPAALLLAALAALVVALAKPQRNVAVAGRAGLDHARHRPLALHAGDDV